MISQENLKLLACPSCYFSLKQSGNKLICSKCGEIFKVINNIPILIPKKLEDDLLLTQKKWNEEYDGGNINVDIKSQPYLRDSFRHLMKFLPSKKGVFLELGCGAAKNSFLLNKETNIKIVGIDISIKAVKLAYKLFKKENRQGFFVCGDIRHLPFKDNAFDYIYGGGTLEHFKDTGSAVSDLFRCIKKGGVLTSTVPYISLSTPYWLRYGNIPNIMGIKQILDFVHTGIFKGRFQPYGYETSFTEKQLTKLFENIGFVNIKFGRMETYYEIKMIKNEKLKNLFRKIAKLRIFWPFVYINGQKPL